MLFVLDPLVFLIGLFWTMNDVIFSFLSIFVDCLELISKLNFLDQEDQDQSNMSCNPFDEPNDPVDLNPFDDPYEDGKDWP